MGGALALAPSLSALSLRFASASTSLSKSWLTLILSSCARRIAPSHAAGSVVMLCRSRGSFPLVLPMRMLYITHMHMASTMSTEAIVHGPALDRGPLRSSCGKRELQPQGSRDRMTSNWERVTCPACLGYIAGYSIAEGIASGVVTE